MVKDPYRYFRVEARELIDGLVQGTLELEKAPASPEVLAKLLRLAHTLKGAARVVKQPRLAELAHQAEERLAGAPLLPGQISAALHLFDEMRVLLQALEPAPAPSAAPSSADEFTQNVRVEVEQLDSLLREVSEVGVHAGALQKDLGTAQRLRQLNRVLLDQLSRREGQVAIAPAALARAVSLAEEVQGELDQLSRGLQSGSMAASRAFRKWLSGSG